MFGLRSNSKTDDSTGACWFIIHRREEAIPLSIIVNSLGMQLRRISAGELEFKVEGMGSELPFTMAIEGANGEAMPLIKRGQHLPASYSQVFTTIESFRTSAFLHLVIGDRFLASDDVTLCTIRYDKGAFQMAGKARYELGIKVTGDGRIKVVSRNLDQVVGAKGPCMSFEKDVITSDVVSSLLEDARLGREIDGMRAECAALLRNVEEDLSSIDVDLWPMARNVMSWREKREYRAFRAQAQKLLSVVRSKSPYDVSRELGEFEKHRIPDMRMKLERHIEVVQGR